jgi:hypothetical protein
MSVFLGRRRFVAGLAGALVAGGTALAGEEAPRLVIEPESFDFGEALQESTLEKEFRLTNQGAGELLIHKIVTSCGCTAAEGYDRVVPPGGSTMLRVSVSTRRDRGRVVRRVLIRSNDPGTQPREVRLEAIVVPRAADAE